MRCDVFKEPNRNGKFTQRLDVIVHMDLSFFDGETFLFQLFCNIGIRDGSV